MAASLLGAGPLAEFERVEEVIAGHDVQDSKPQFVWRHASRFGGSAECADEVAGHAVNASCDSADRPRIRPLVSGRARFFEEIAHLSRRDSASKGDDAALDALRRELQSASLPFFEIVLHRSSAR